MMIGACCLPTKVSAKSMRGRSPSPGRCALRHHVEWDAAPLQWQLQQARPRGPFAVRQHSSVDRGQSERRTFGGRIRRQPGFRHPQCEKSQCATKRTDVQRARRAQYSKLARYLCRIWRWQRRHEGDYGLFKWDAGSGSAATTVWSGTDAIMTSVACGAYIAAASGDPGIAVIGADDNVAFAKPRPGADMRDKLGEAFTVSADGTRVRFGLGLGATDPVVFDLKGSDQLRDGSSKDDDLRPPRVDTLPVSNWKNSTKPRYAGKEIKLDGPEQSRSLAIAEDGRTFFLGCDYHLNAYTDTGALRWSVKTRALYGASIRH